jgi:hypothetical protein
MTMQRTARSTDAPAFSLTFCKGSVPDSTDRVRSRSDLPAYDDVADFQTDDIATAQLAVDGKIELHSIANSLMLVEIEADAPYLFWLQSSLCPDLSSSVPGLPVSRSGIKL